MHEDVTDYNNHASTLGDDRHGVDHSRKTSTLEGVARFDIQMTVSKREDIRGYENMSTFPSPRRLTGEGFGRIGPQHGPGAVWHVPARFFLEELMGILTTFRSTRSSSSNL